MRHQAALYHRTFLGFRRGLRGRSPRPCPQSQEEGLGEAQCGP